MRFSVLSSGSKSGNAIYVEGKSGGMIIDCGVPLTLLNGLLCRISRTRADVKLCMYTHSHGDHAKHAVAMARSWRIPVVHPSIMKSPQFQRALDIATLECSLNVFPFVVPHAVFDGNYGFAFEDNGRKLVVILDAGCFSPDMIVTLRGAHAIVLGVDYDDALLEVNETYYEELKARIRSPTGHMSNAAAAEFFRYQWDGVASRVVVAHLSLMNNKPELARRAISDAIVSNENNNFAHVSIEVSSPLNPTALFEV